LLLGVLHCGQHRSKQLQKSKRITAARLRGAETPEVNQCRSVSDKIAIANGIRQQYDSMATRAETKHFASLT
jgi:hypothetical protein